MTHEHMDHVQGLCRLNSIGRQVPAIDYAWLTGSAHPRYYQRFPEARKRIQLYRAAYDQVRLAAAQRGLLGRRSVRAFLANNDSRSTADCVTFLRKVARRRTYYVDRSFKPIAGGIIRFARRDFRSGDRRGKRRRTTADAAAAPVLAANGDWKKGLRAPVGVSQDALDALLKFASSGLGDNMLAIDRAANNTSVVFELEWRGWRLLFSGDAELRSWRMMERHQQLRPVHFLKVGHHASQNGTPPDSLLEKILPCRGRTTAGAQHWCLPALNVCGVPDDETVTRIRRRTDRIHLTTQVDLGKAVEIEFDG